MTQNTADTPLACLRLADVFDPETRQRHKALWEMLVNRTRGVQELATGYAFCFPLEDRLFRDLAEFITYERLCCPFFQFALALDPVEGEIRLGLTGGEGVKDFLAAELADRPLIP